jgi:PAS domain S-box-containing protein
MISPKKNVLVLNSYNYGYGWTDSIMKGIESALKPGAYILNVEYMDTKRIEDDTYFEKLYDLYKYRFKNAVFDVIIASDDNAFNFLKTYKNDLFGELVPIVFCGVNYFRDEDIASRRDITGVVEEYDVKGTIEIMDRIHPNLKEIVVISDKTATGVANTRKTREIFSQYFPGHIYTVLDYLSMAELLQRVKDLPSETAALYLGFIIDRTGQSFVPLEESLAAISRESKVPLYSVWEFTLESVVGGMITSGFYQGETAARMAQRLLAGETAAGIPVMKVCPNVPMFNYEQMVRFGIDRARLPAESLIIHAPQTAYPVEKGWIISVAVVFLLLLSAILGLVVNIRRRYHAEKAAQTEKERYRLLVKQVPGIVYQGYADYSMDCFDDKIEALTGYKQEEFNSRAVKWNTLLLEEYVEPLKNQLKHALKNDGFYVSEFRIRKKSGEIIWVQSRNQVVKNTQGRMERISGVFFDITEHKRVEESLRESEEYNRQLYAGARRTAELYRSLLSSSADAIVIYDMEGRVQFLSPSFTRIFGWGLEELFGKTIPFVPDSEIEATMNEVRKVLEGATCSNFESLRYDKSGGILNVTLSASRYTDHEGTPAGILVILRDMTQTKIMETQFRQAQKMEAVGTLAGGVAHDFNNLLQAINGYAELLLLDKSPEDAGYHNLMQIQKACSRAAQLIQQLLAFSRKVEGVRRRLDLNQEVLEAEKVLHRTIPKMIAIELRLSGSLWSVHADPVQLEQILLNLGSNAADAMPEGGRLVIETQNVSVDEEFCRDHLGAKPGNYVLLSVSDTGPGMDQETLQHIFEPFFTTKEVGKGTGLGLASVYGIVKSLGGYISCSSEPGQGAIFKIYLPAVEHVGTQAEGGAEETALRGGNETILVVDDEAPVRDVATEILRYFGYEVLAADSGEAALDLYRTREGGIDLIVLDLGMPGMGGHKCLRELKAIDSSAKVLIASGYSMDSLVRESLEIGGVGFVGKPYQLKDLVTKIRMFLDG